MIYGVLNLSFWGYVIIFFAFTQLTIISVTLYLHRYQTHRAIELHPIVSHIFRYWLWLTTAMVTKEWVAVHRKHHATVETEDDPHSPVIHGIKKLLLEGVELYRVGISDQELVEKYGAGTPNDWIERNVYQKYSRFGPVIMLLLNLILLGIPGLTVWALQMAWIPFFAAGVINGVGHYWGYRNYEVADASRNIIPWGILLGGEELHNNHHAFGSSAKFSTKWWEVDFGWGVICLLSWFGLAKVKRLAPHIDIQPNKRRLDLESVKAILANRFQVLASYYKQVTLPVFRAEKQRVAVRERSLFKRAGKLLLLRDQSLLSSSSKQRLKQLLAKREHLQIVYQFRLQLQELWGKTTVNPKELLESLQLWCKRAEATGIEVLRKFADDLHGVVLTKA